MSKKTDNGNDHGNGHHGKHFPVYTSLVVSTNGTRWFARPGTFSYQNNLISFQEIESGRGVGVSGFSLMIDLSQDEYEEIKKSYDLIEQIFDFLSDQGGCND